MTAPMDALYYINQAKKCRRLAKQADADTASKLTALAEEYEAKATLYESGP
jgi:hypothetical protein